MVTRKNCMSCGSYLNTIINLGYQPWCNNFLKKDELGKEEKYPLVLTRCTKCSLLQLNYFVPKEKMFKNHTYVSGTTKTLAKHFYDLAEENIAQFNLSENDLIVDIGGNDGTQLKQYQEIFLKKKSNISIGLEDHFVLNVLNIESADNIAKLSINSKVPTINNYFNEELVDDMLSGCAHVQGNPFRNKTDENKKAKLINASGVFFHLEEIHSVLKGVKKLLDKNGVFVIQFMYAKSIIENGTFDAIYHEHLFYYTIHSLLNLLKLYDLDIFDGYFSEIHSGSMIVKCCHKNDKINIKTSRYDKVYKEDIEFNKSLNEKLEYFKYSVKEFKNNIYNYLLKLKSEGCSIYCLGAPAKGNTLINYCDIGKFISKIYETNDLKVGLYSPGSHIEIFKENKDDLPNCFLLLSHNFLNEIKEKFPQTVFIVPFYNNKQLTII